MGGMLFHFVWSCHACFTFWVHIRRDLVRGLVTDFGNTSAGDLHGTLVTLVANYGQWQAET